MSTRTAISVAVFAVLVLALGLAGTAGARSMGLGEGAVFGEGNPSRDMQETIWFQGFVADAGTGEPTNATYTVTARMYDAEFGGASVWGPESHLATVIVDGWFNIELGVVIGGLPAFDAPPYYLQLTIDGEMLAPRLKLASVPSAFQSLGADNGLNLPYSAIYGTSGNAFHITNTGPNICGYFVIQNAGSTATAVYGAHNGPGAAVMGWQTGTGPAIRGVANSSGYAGVFEGSVTVSDSLVAQGMIKGRSLFAEHSVAAGGTLACANFWMARDPVPGYVMRCQDTWGNAEWGPPNVIDSNMAGGFVSLASGDVVHHTGAEVTLTVPGPGYIVIESRVWFAFDHTSGTTDKLWMEHSTSSTVSSGVFANYYLWEEPSSLGTVSDLDRTVLVSNTFEITSGGTYTYYLIGWMSAGNGSGDTFKYTQTTGIYYPYPVVVRAASDGDMVFPTTAVDGVPR